MSSHVRYWSVGSSTEERLPLTAGQIAGYLMMDWLPQFPPATGSQFVAWPKQLVRKTDKGDRYLALHPALRNSERQWKGFLSWMIGVAATRRVLAEEGYHYVAPASAFYPEAATLAATGRWPKPFSPGRLTVAQDPSSKSRLRPDYVAVRRDKSRGWEFASVESKGTSRSLASLSSCPPAWHNQARNIVVEQDGKAIPLSRHLVVAARSNPNAKTEAARRIQVRAWNFFFFFFAEAPHAGRAVVSIAAADWYGRLLNSRLSSNAELLRLGQLRRQVGPDAFPQREEARRAQLRADAERERRTLLQGSNLAELPLVHFSPEALRELSLLQSSQPTDVIAAELDEAVGRQQRLALPGFADRTGSPLLPGVWFEDPHDDLG